MYFLSEERTSEMQEAFFSGTSSYGRASISSSRHKRTIYQVCSSFFSPPSVPPEVVEDAILGRVKDDETNISDFIVAGDL